MADIELVIKIDEKTYNEIKEGFYYDNVRAMAIAIGNGTPLPKGHGDLIDRSKLGVHYIGTNIGTDCPVYLLPTVDEAPTIIEADKEKEND